MGPTLKKTALLLTGLVALDQLIKAVIPEPVMNPGFFLGSFGEASAFYRIFCMSVVLAITLLALFLAQFLLWKSFPQMILLLTLLEAGLLGNGIDKIWLGQVRDYLPIPGTNPPFVVNLADLYLWAAIALLLWNIWRHPRQFWPEKDLRNQFLLYPRSQTRMIAVLMLIAGVIGLGNFLLLVGYLKAVGIAFDIREVTLCFGLFTALVFSILFVFGALWSNRIYGPFKAIARYLRARPEDGSRVGIRTRAADEDEALREILRLIDQDRDDRGRD